MAEQTDKPMNKPSMLLTRVCIQMIDPLSLATFSYFYLKRKKSRRFKGIEMLIVIFNPFSRL